MLVAVASLLAAAALLVGFAAMFGASGTGAGVDDRASVD